MLALIAAAVIAALLGTLIGFAFGEKTGGEREIGKPRTVCTDYKLVASTATHGDYAGAGGETYTIRKDEIAARVGKPEIADFPKALRVCVTVVAGHASTAVSIP